MSEQEKCYIEGCKRRVVALVDFHDGKGMRPCCDIHDPKDIC